MLISTNRRELTREEQTWGIKLTMFWRSPLRRKALTMKQGKRNQNVIPVPPLKSYLCWGNLLGHHTVPVICFDLVTSPLQMSIFLPDKGELSKNVPWEPRGHQWRKGGCWGRLWPPQLVGIYLSGQRSSTGRSQLENHSSWWFLRVSPVLYFSPASLFPANMLTPIWV